MSLFSWLFRRNRKVDAPLTSSPPPYTTIQESNHDQKQSLHLTSLHDTDQDIEDSLYQDINPPTDLQLSQPTTTQPEIDSKPQETTSLPIYNDVSGAVVVDEDGLPRFLSAEEEVERRLKLEQAVRERMLGLPRSSEFTWRPEKESLPLYSSSK